MTIEKTGFLDAFARGSSTCVCEHGSASVGPACTAGTHVSRSTREVGQIRVTGYESKGRINKRIRIELVDPA